MIKVTNLNFNYGKKRVLENISMELQEGKIYGLLGQNGVGKSTLLKLLSGILKPKGGAIDINGFNPFDRKPSFLEKVFYLPEDFMGPDIKVDEYAKQVGVFYEGFSYERFSNIISEFDVDKNSKFTKLSFGQQKKAIIALALSLGTKVLLMDEPSNGLDIPSKVILRRMIAENAMDDQIIIISTHQVKDLENLIDPIIIMDNDGVLLNESIESIAKKLTFSLEAKKDDSALYTQTALNGYVTIRVNNGYDETQVDIEALFNCVLANRRFIKEVFNSNLK